jgi:amino acid permease/DNA-binding Lrp family transcriptional regulator
VQRAHEQLYGRGSETIFATRLSLRERLRWARAAAGARFGSLPPFWTAFALTLTGTVGGGVFALPIALAGVGPIPGVILLVLFGALNVLTVAWLAQGAARSASVRYANAYFGRLVGEFLGGTAEVIASVAVTAVCVATLLAFYVGLAATLGHATPIPPALWMVVLFALQLFFLSRSSLSPTIVSAIATGAVNVALIVALGVLGLAHASAANLLHMNLPFLGGRPFDASLLRLIFGVVLIAYFGHFSAVNCAQVVLRRDPGGRALVWGSAAGMATVVVLYAGWVVAVNGAVDRAVLVGQSGTAIGPLAERVGPVAHVIGSVFVVLAMGMASIHLSLALFNLVRDRLPRLRGREVVLPRGRVRLTFAEARPGRREVRLVLEYLGRASGEARFRAEVPHTGGTRRVELGVTAGRDAPTELPLGSDPAAKNLAVRMQVLDADDVRVRLRVDTPLAVSVEGDWAREGAGLLDALELADDERRVVTTLMRHGELTLGELSARLECAETAAGAMLEQMVARGLIRRVESVEGVRFGARLGQRHGRALPAAMWNALAPAMEAERRRGVGALASAAVSRARDLIQSPRVRLALALAPTVVIFILAEWLLFVGADSFSAALNIAGAVGASLIAGVLPTVLLSSLIRKGEIVPRIRLRLGGRVIRCVVYATFVAGLVLHAVLIWDGVLERACGLAVAIVCVAATVVMARRGAFRQRVTVEVRRERSRAVVNLVDGGQARRVEATLRYGAREVQVTLAPNEAVTAEALKSVTLAVPDTRARELKVWTHRITADGESEVLPALVTVQRPDGADRIDITLTGGQAVVPLRATSTRIEIAWQSA